MEQSVSTLWRISSVAMELLHVIDRVSIFISIYTGTVRLSQYNFKLGFILRSRVLDQDKHIQ